MRTLLLLSLVSACGVPVEPLNIALAGQLPNGTIELGERILWQAYPPLELLGVVELPGAPLTLQVGDAPTQVLMSGSIDTKVTVPLSQRGLHDVPVEVRSNNVAVARWVVRQTGVDPGLKVCVAEQGPEVEDLNAPLTRCAQASLEGGIAFTVPNLWAGALTEKRLRLSTRLGTFEVRSQRAAAAFNLPSGDEITTTLTSAAPVEVNVQPQSFLAIGQARLDGSWQPATKPFDDRTLAAPPHRIRVGNSADLVRTLSATRPNIELVAVEDPLLQVVATTALPLPLPVGSSTGLTFRLAPSKAEGGPRALVLRFKDGDGLIKTDRILIDTAGVAASACRLEIDELELGPMTRGEVKVFSLTVRNTGVGACDSTRVAAPTDSEVTFSEKPIPAPGLSSTWRGRFTAGTAGVRVVPIEVRYDDAPLTVPDLMVRVQATVSP